MFPCLYSTNFRIRQELHGSKMQLFYDRQLDHHLLDIRPVRIMNALLWTPQIVEIPATSTRPLGRLFCLILNMLPAPMAHAYSSSLMDPAVRAAAWLCKLLIDHFLKL